MKRSDGYISQYLRDFIADFRISVSREDIREGKLKRKDPEGGQGLLYAEHSYIKVNVCLLILI